MLKMRPFLVFLFSLVLTGCLSSTPRELLTEKTRPADASAIAAKHEIFITTTRARSADSLEVYSRERSFEAAYARADVTVPKIHQVGQIERRTGKVGDPAKFFTATDVTVYNKVAFENAVRKDIAKNGGRALIFIHGYNTAFDGAVYRITQIVHDAGYTGTPVLFSWASGGKVVDYVYDNNSATAARDELENTMRMVARLGATRIDIIAHSMGNWATMEALRQLAISGDPTLSGKMGDVLLASPDIDIDVFRAQLHRYGKPKRPFFVLISQDDRALNLSRIIAGDQGRVGANADPEELSKLGVAVVDLSQIKGDKLSHTKFAENPVMIKMIGEGLQRDVAVNERQVTDQVNDLSRNLGSSLTSAAEIVITTPLNVLRVAVGQ